MKDHSLLLDSDIIAFKFASTAEARYDFDGDGDITQVVEDISVVKDAVDDEIDKYMATLKGTRPIVCLSCDSADNFRKDFLPSYKENRKGVLKPLHLMAAKLHMVAKYESFQRPRLEADDVMGILSTHHQFITGRKTIVSEDKDMGTIPGWWYNPRKAELKCVGRTQADRYHMYQTLTGDSTDNYKGAPGIGPVKADKILEGPSCRWWVDVVETFKVRLNSTYEVAEAAALVQARCARILRATDYNYTNKEVIPWTPSK
jgi:DNA polymerase-1